MVLIRLKTAAFKPIPAAKITTAIAVNPGFLHSVRQQKRTPLSHGMLVRFYRTGVSAVIGCYFVSVRLLGVCVDRRPPGRFRSQLCVGYRVKSSLCPTYSHRAASESDRRL